MEDLRQTALAYCSAFPSKRQQVEKCFEEMGPNDKGYVRFEKFSVYMDDHGYKDMVSRKYFKELKQPGEKGLYFNDIVTLFYIIQSGRPFCGGACKKLVTGMYFICVKCFSDNKNKNEYSTFSVCLECFGKKKYGHCHNDFLDPIVLLQYKRWEELNKERGTSIDTAGEREARRSRASTSSGKETKMQKHERSTPSVRTVLVDPSASRTSSTAASRTDKPGMSSSPSSAIVPAVPRRSKPAKMQTAIQFAQLLANLASIAATSPCTFL